MTDLRKLLNEASYLAGRPIPDNDFIRLYNMAAFNLATQYDTAKTENILTVDCNDTKTEHNLSKGCLKVVRVLDSNDKNYKEFKVRNHSRILFNHKGTYKVYELVVPERVTNMEDDFVINEVYNQAILYYIAAKVVRKENKETHDEFMAEFMNNAMLANKSIRNADNPYKRIKTPLWR